MKIEEFGDGSRLAIVAICVGSSRRSVGHRCDAGRAGVTYRVRSINGAFASIVRMAKRPWAQACGRGPGA